MKIEIKNISKTFGDLIANSEISISINNGIHALLGENGAGKSTLVKIISGQITPDYGEILINGDPLILGSPKKSIENGIGLLNQDPLDFGNLSVLETFLVGIKDKNPYRNLERTKQNISDLFKKYKTLAFQHFTPSRNPLCCRHFLLIIKNSTKAPKSNPRHPAMYLYKK